MTNSSNKVTTIKANPNATNSELDAKIIIERNNLTDEDYLNIIHLIRTKHPTTSHSDLIYWNGIIDILYKQITVNKVHSL